MFHLLETNIRPNDNSTVMLSCGIELPFVPVSIMFAEADMCDECMKMHRSNTFNKKTFVLYNPDD
jgi:hypothetical protein